MHAAQVPNLLSHLFVLARVVRTFVASDEIAATTDNPLPVIAAVRQSQFNISLSSSHDEEAGLMHPEVKMMFREKRPTVDVINNRFAPLLLSVLCVQAWSLNTSGY